MTDFVRILTRRNSLRKQCQELSIDELSKVIADLTNILKEHQLQDKKLVEEKQAKIKKIAGNSPGDVRFWG